MTSETFQLLSQLCIIASMKYYNAITNINETIKCVINKHVNITSKCTKLA